MKNQHKKIQRPSFPKVLKKSSLSFLAMAPLLLGIIGLVGLFQVLITPKMLASLFRGNALVDTVIGTFVGAAAAGNPVVSYLLGGELLAQGISLYAVTAFILSWVTLGFIQLPAEVDVFGGRFVLYRNVLAFIFTMIIAVLTTLTLRVLL
ncbi:MAG TPA: permease [Desulfobulbaceae bacterium]|nr:permease [Desulfobulbaceae bacterium]